MEGAGEEPRRAVAEGRVRGAGLVSHPHSGLRPCPLGPPSPACAARDLGCRPKNRALRDSQQGARGEGVSRQVESWLWK